MGTVEQAIFASTKVSIKSTYSGGAYYSYSPGMEELLGDIGSKMNGYITTISFDSSINSLEDYVREMPSKLAYALFDIGDEKIFSISRIRPARDFGSDRAESVRGREGSKISHIIAGNAESIETYPILYLDADIFKNMPYTESDLSNNIQPTYMSSYQGIKAGKGLAREEVINRLKGVPGYKDILKELFCYLLHQEDAAGRVRPLVLCCEPELMIYWIAAISYLLPVKYAKKITFSTYEFNPRGKNSDFRIIGVYPDGTSYDDIEKDGLLIYDMLHEGSMSQVEIGDSGIYDFLIDNLLDDSGYDKMLKFHDFLNGFSGICLNDALETIYDFYEIIEYRAQRKIAVSSLEKAIVGLGECVDKELETKVINQILKLYINYDEYDEVSSDYLMKQVKKGKLDKEVLVAQLINCMDQFIKMPNTNITSSWLQAKQIRFNQLLLKLQDNFIVKMTEEVCLHVDRYFTYQGDNTDISYDVFVDRNQFLLSNILTYMNLKKIPKNVLAEKDSKFYYILYLVSDNVLQCGCNQEKKEEFFESFVKRLEEEPIVYFSCIRLWEDLAYKSSRNNMITYFEIIRKNFISQFSDGYVKLCEALYQTGYHQEIFSVFRNIDIRSYGVEHVLYEVEQVVTKHPDLAGEVSVLVREFYDNCKNIDDKMELYKFAYKHCLFEKALFDTMAKEIVNNFPLIVSEKKRVDFIEQLEETLGGINTDRYCLMKELLKIKKLKNSRSCVNDLKTGRIDHYICTGIDIDVFKVRNEVTDYLRGVVEELMELYRMTKNPSILVRGAFLIKDKRIVEKCLEIELDYIVQREYKKRQVDISELLNGYVIEIFAYAEEFIIYEREMAKYLANSKLKMSRLYPVFQSNTGKMVKQSKKRFADGRVTEEQVLGYWDSVQKYLDEMTEDKMSIGKIIGGFFGHKKE